MLVTDLVPLCSALKSSFPWAASPANDEEALSRMLSRVLAPLPPDHLPPLVGKGLPALIPGPMPLGAKLRVSLDGVLGAASLGGAGVTAPWPGGSGAEGSASLPRKVPGTFPTWPWAEAVPCNLQLPPLFVKHFSSLKDPRVNRRKRHRLVDIVVIGLCAVICGAEGWEDIEEFGRRREQWLRGVLGLKLPHGIPGHDTIRRVFNRLDPEELNRCIRDWLSSLRRGRVEEVIALDGKTVRHSYDTRTGQPAIHLVSAWATESGLSLGQVKVDGKSNEITALPQLLKLLDVTGCTVTIDAMGCQKRLARQIREQGGHYVLALKGNQEGLREAVELLFTDALAHDWYRRDPSRRIEHDHSRVVGKDHGRLETRDYWVISGRQVAELTQAGDWEGLRSVVLVESKRERGDTVSIERRYFITSHEGKAAKIGGAIREHWRVENGLHYVLDVAMDEDACGIWKENGPENLATLRRAAVSLLRQEHSSPRGVKARMKIAAMDTDYLLRVLSV